MAIVRSLAIWLMVGCWVVAAMPKGYWGYKDGVDLAKDQVVHYTIDSAKNEAGYRFDFFFRWTLWKERGLVMHFSFDGFRRQTILYPEYKRDTFRYFYRDRHGSSDEKPMIMIRLLALNDQNKTATFEVLVRDPKRTIVVERNMSAKGW